MCPGRVEEVRYSTTSGTNALLVRKGVRVGLITSLEGAGDLYGLRRTAPDLLEVLVGDRVVGVQMDPAVPGTDDASVSEPVPDQNPESSSELAPDPIRGPGSGVRDPGQALNPIIVGAIRELLGQGTQWVVVSFPEPWGGAGEREFKRRYMRLFPGHLLGSVPVLFSRELCADPHDGRRTATAVLNGFLHREMARFLYHADGWVRERHVRQPLRILRNDGGCGRVAKTTTVKTLDSGPMGGLSGGAALARLSGLDRVVTLDVGGTSTDLGLIERQRPVVELLGAIHHLPFSFSFPALRTAAFGGGSLFRVQGGAIAIGPESAGALPGPACFGRGGNEPTLTDAALLAGYLDAAQFAGGSIRLRPDLAEQVIVEQIVRPLGLEDAQAGVWAMIEAFAERLAREIRGVLERCAWSAQEAVLVAYGGSGPLLACMVAERVGLQAFVIPPASASFSALGVGFVDLAHESRAFLREAVDGDRGQELIRGLRVRAERDMFGENVPRSDCTGALRLRCEGDGREYEVGESLVLPDGLGAEAGEMAGMVLDYRLAWERGEERTFPTLERGEGTRAGEAERMVLIDRKPSRLPIVPAAGPPADAGPRAGHR